MQDEVHVFAFGNGGGEEESVGGSGGGVGGFGSEGGEAFGEGEEAGVDFRALAIEDADEIAKAQAEDFGSVAGF